MYPPPSIGVPLALPEQPVLPPLPALPPLPTLPAISPSSLLSSNPITAWSPSEIINTLSDCTTDPNTLLSSLFASLNPTGQIQQIRQILAVAHTQLDRIRDSLDHIFVYCNNRSKAKNSTSGDRKEWVKVATEVLALVGYNDVTARLNCKVIDKLCSRFGYSSLVELPLGQAKSYLRSGFLREMEQASQGWDEERWAKVVACADGLWKKKGKGKRRGNNGWGAEIFRKLSVKPPTSMPSVPTLSKKSLDSLNSTHFRIRRSKDTPLETMMEIMTEAMLQTAKKPTKKSQDRVGKRKSQESHKMSLRK
ncbi:hypothetical protein JCM16303_003125 [Sporobolomyces ruberrimus]